MRAVEASQVLLAQKAGFLALLKRQPELALRVPGAMSAHLRVLIAQFEDLTMEIAADGRTATLKQGEAILRAELLSPAKAR